MEWIWYNEKQNKWKFTKHIIGRRIIMIELICIGTLITIVIIISDRKKSKKYRKKHKTPKQKGIEGENVISNIIQYAPMYKKIVRNAWK